ncbi:hypothetical protein AAF712_002189 [Marasmius tenuissimus]|uniref:Uncharacterized protein n=1 Tax=Marasmius tenuissimus TaxID=585030 RepID=A0ABR3AD95_9AGAR
MPGVHSTAGPLPPPPRASFIVNNGPGGSTPPPRPPRQVRSPSPTKTAGGRSVSPTKGITTTVQERERGRKSFSKEQDDKDKDMREALKLSPEVTAVLTSRLAPVTKVKSASEADGKSANATARTDEHDRSVMPTSSAAAVSTASSSGAIAAETQSPAIVTKSVHMREGAFAPSTIISPMTTTPSTSTSSSTTPSIYPDANSPSLPTHTTQTVPERRRRRKVASSSSYEEYTLEETPEEEDGAESEYDTCGRKVHESSADVAVAITSSQPVIKPPPRNQSLAATNAMGISGLPVEDEGWVLADNVGEGAVSYGKRSLDGIPKTPSRDRDKVPERHSLDSPSSSYESEGPSPPPKSFRNSFTKGLKRLSLNAGSPRRSDSLSSRSAHSRTPSQGSSTLPPLPDAEGGYTGRPSLSPSPSPNAFPPRPLSPLNPNSHSPNPSLPVPLPLGPSSLQNSPHPSYSSYYTRPHPHAHKRITNTQPAALFCSELYSAPKKSSTSAERCAIYARKLNELYMFDCGLGDWIVGVGPGTGTRGPSNGVAVISFTDTPRKSSHGSTMSEATFPRRPDATLATDLMIPPTISSASSSGPLSPVSSAPRLPYPSLLTKNNSGDKERGGGGLLGSLTTPTSSGRGTGGFFASLGRKASMNRHRGGSSDSGHSTATKARLTKAPPNAGSAATVHGNTISSPVLVNSSQSVPGGPRALPGRAKTLMLSPSPSPNKEQFYGGSNSGSESGSGPLGRRPSMYNLGSSPSIESPQGMLRSDQRRDGEKENDPMFSSQVNRLADLLPHVEKDVLAGYLRRAGQDILAIGQYLDDEKNGRVRRD